MEEKYDYACDDCVFHKGVHDASFGFVCWCENETAAIDYHDCDNHPEQCSLMVCNK